MLTQSTSLNNVNRVMRTLFFLCIVWALLLLCSACRRDRAEVDAEPQAPSAPREPTSPPPPTPLPPPQPTGVIHVTDTNLLATEGVVVACDSPAEAEFTCRNEADNPQLQVNISAATYARWSLRWAGAEKPLRGTETLALRVHRAGEVQPNLYLVEADGDRIAVNLNRYGLREGWNELHIPLPEFRGENGEVPAFSTLTEIQIVFEWSDMTGELVLARLAFDSVWREEVAPSDKAQELAAALSVPSGFTIQPVADKLRSVTQIQYTPVGGMLVSLQNGRVWWYRDTDGDNTYDQRHLYTAGLSEVVGLLYDPNDGAVWLGGHGQLFHTQDSDGDGVADDITLRIDGLPWGRHQNNGLAWNPDPDPFTGEEGQRWIYFGLGSTEDLEIGGPYNAAVVRFPRDGQGGDALEVVSRGNRNPYMVVWGNVPLDGDKPDGERAWQLFASKNGPDFNDAPDEVNHIRWQHHYGFPDRFGPQTTDELLIGDEIEGMPYSGSLYAVIPHASASGLAYIDNPAWPAEYRTLYVSLFGQVFSEEIVGHTVDRITLEPITTDTGESFHGQPDNFITGLDRPLPMATDPAGDLIVGDYATGVIYRVSYIGSAN